MPMTLADEVFESLHGLMHQYRHLQYRALRGGAEELTHMEHKVLGFFSVHPGATQSDLVQHAGRDKAQVARLIKGLRDRGLLEGQPDEADRRSIRLTVTAEGAAAHEVARTQASQVNAQAVAGLEEGDCRQLLALLGRIRGNLDAVQPDTRTAVD
ncbi:MarR family winged helix-turn-helix transcriptional regulator [Metapseudomonas furukawaii]|jgi:DNA-binding MarR family transcriptional regulator|uniref:Transcriptional regulator n=1 Tax=Metapseudomonas furukawaii TaxID=1149133 RepID=A0AAD1C0Q8_METFU|nr:MarR family transcriptional regulator [Pseudomonas furukawaii]ELS26606.1 transcriptional regulator, MarR family [Pseudomonas furukawaii]WAG81679.1 MarR family transcriptional regulator [Pseudomonas furukawaii]BAU74436.1 transcriptional regulator [Pseudomonas furukawaii]